MAEPDEVAKARENTRLTLYKAIADQTENAKGLIPQAGADALKNLAEAFAHISTSAVGGRR